MKPNAWQDIHAQNQQQTNRSLMTALKHQTSLNNSKQNKCTKEQWFYNEELTFKNMQSDRSPLLYSSFCSAPLSILPFCPALLSVLPFSPFPFSVLLLLFVRSPCLHRDPPRNLQAALLESPSSFLLRMCVGPPILQYPCVSSSYIEGWFF